MSKPIFPQIRCCDPPRKGDGYFVYCFVIDGAVRYIGKGTRRRPWDHLTEVRFILERHKSRDRATVFHKRLASAIRKQSDIEIKIIQRGLSESDALSTEIDFIAQIGRSNLWNMTDGGDGLTSDVAKILNNKPETKAKNIASVKKAHSDPSTKERHRSAIAEAYTRPEVQERHKQAMAAAWSPERRAQQAERLKLRWAAGGEEARQRQRDVINRVMTSEVRAKVTQGNTGRVMSDEERERRAASVRAFYKNPENVSKLKGKRRPDHEAQSARTAQMNKERWADPEKRAIFAAKISETLKRKNREKKA